jgi:hypothetical protein
MRQTLELALDALERSVSTCFDQYAHQQVMSQPNHFMNQAITAIKEALAQQDDPVGWMNKHGACISAAFKDDDSTYIQYTIPLYIAKEVNT